MSTTSDAAVKNPGMVDNEHNMSTSPKNFTKFSNTKWKKFDTITYLDFFTFSFLKHKFTHCILLQKASDALPFSGNVRNCK